jgi:hypothetical protein
MTIGFWIVAIIVALAGIAWGIYLIYIDEPGQAWAVWIVTLVLFAIITGVGYWYCNNTAGGVRALKDQHSSLNNGLNREIIITAEDGREIFYYKGKCDIETANGYILFEGEDGLRRMIYYGALDTIIVLELP